MKKDSQPIRVLMVGTDLTSNGGIASVVKSYYKVYKKTELPLKLDLLKTGYYKDKNKLSELLILIRSFFLFFSSLLRKKYDIIHCHSSGGLGFYRASIFLLVGNFFSVKTIIHLHASNFYEFFIPSKTKKKYVKYILANCNTVISLCNDWTEKLNKSHNLTNVITIHNPIDVISNYQNKKQVIQQGKLNVLFIGFLIESKGIRDIVELAKKFKENNIENIVLQIGGKGDLEKYLLNEISNNNLQNHIEYIGWVSGEKKENAYINADIFFLPSYKEGMPITILEAMNYGLPIVSTKIAGIPDEVIEGKNGYLFTPGKIDDFYEAFISITNNPEKLNEMSKYSIQFVKKFDTKMIFKEIFQIYNKI